MGAPAFVRRCRRRVPYVCAVVTSIIISDPATWLSLRDCPTLTVFGIRSVAGLFSNLLSLGSSALTVEICYVWYNQRGKS
ncbi:hypothetical protein BDP81DRAFT_417098 [Colletotrichum phormii]|uniref:Uncharacterized protein n=1 Tax=Colletotrichum phormii TaxID=359342 RepID=A0AAJ0A209_9PEZI|nr:uncharacterized protein BDP81DRAFT_417098 [Colletotrichum phormii]KAK1655017.1 hypothetical protein BDP81DRAFT_417098 [Colletotrichum phormii]